MYKDLTRKSLIIILLSIIIFIDNVGDTAVNVALPSIAGNFDIDSSFFMQSFISGYLIAAASSLVFFGKIADSIGIKRVFIFGVALLIITSAVIGLSSNCFLVLGSRILQGLAFSLTYPLIITLGRMSFLPQEQGFLMGIISTLSSLSLAVGPLLAGLLLQFLNWRYVFFINIPLGVLALIISILFVKEKVRTDLILGIDFKGVFFYSTSLVCLLLTFFNGDNTNLEFKITFLLLSLILFTLFYVSQRKSANPLIDLSILQSSLYKIGNLIRFCGQLVLFSLFFIFSISFQNIYVFSSLKTGLVFLSITLSITIFSVISGKLIDKIGPFKILKFGIICMAIACALFLRLNQTTSNVEIAIPMIIMGIGSAFFLPSINNITLNAIPKGKDGVGTGIYFTIVTLAGAFGTVISSEILSLKSSYKINMMLSKSLSNMSNFQLESLLAIGSGKKSISFLPQLELIIIPEYLYSTIYEAFFYALRMVIWFWLILILITFFLSFFLDNAKHDHK